MAFFHLLLPHAINYCNNGLTIPKQYREAFKRNIEDRDPFSEVFDVFVPSENPDDMVAKQDVMQWINLCSTLPQWQRKFSIVLQKFKSKGIKYDSQKVLIIDGIRKKGWFSGVKRLR